MPLLRSVDGPGVWACARRSLKRPSGGTGRTSLIAILQAPAHFYVHRWRRSRRGLGLRRFRSLGKLQWPTVRVVCYRQRRPDGSTVQARVLTDFTHKSSRRIPVLHGQEPWEIENKGINDAKNPPRHGASVPSPTEQHHSRLAPDGAWPSALSDSVRLRHLHRGTHACRSAAGLVQLFCLSLGRKPRSDSSWDVPELHRRSLTSRYLPNPPRRRE